MFCIMNATEPYPIPECLPHSLSSFMKSCLQHDPADRHSAASLLGHTFLQSSEGLGTADQLPQASVQASRESESSPAPTTGYRTNLSCWST
eukprot:gene11457-9951_t